MRHAWLLCLAAILVTLAANSYFVITALEADGRTPTLTEKANSHFVSYFLPVSGVVGTGSLFRDPCLLEHQDTTVPRIHLTYAFYGVIHSIVQNPFFTHLVGNILLGLLTVGFAMLLGKSEFGSPWLGLLLGAFLFVAWTPDNLVKMALLARTLVLTGSFSALITPLTLTITRTLAIPIGLLGMYFFLAHARKPTRTKAVMFGVILAVSPFVHFFLAVILLVSTAIGILWLAWKRETQLKAWILTGAIAFPALAIYAIFITVVSHQSFFADLAVDYVIFTSRVPMLPPLIPLFAMLLASACILFSSRSRAFKAFCTGLLISMFVGMNLQLVFGQNPQPHNWWHWVYTFLIPLAGVVLVAEVFRKTRNAAIGVLLTCVLILLVSQGYVMTVKVGEGAYREPSLGEALDWIRFHVTPQEVVLAPLDITNRVNLETSAKTYVCDTFQNTATFRENAVRYLQTEWIFETPPDSVQQRIMNYSTKSSFVLHLLFPVKANMFGTLMSRTIPSYPDESYAEIIKQRRAEVQELVNSTEAQQVSFALDYVLARKGESMQACLALIPVFANSAYVIYRVNPTACARAQPLIS